MVKHTAKKGQRGKNKRTHRDKREVFTEIPGGYQPATFVMGLEKNEIQIQRRPDLSELDCGISSLELLGIIDSTTANILRLTEFGRRSGLKIRDTELMFMYANYVSNGEYREYNYIRIEDLTGYLREIPNGHGTIIHLFDYISVSHSLTIHKINGTLWYYDPQYEPSFGLLSDMCNFDNNTYRIQKTEIGIQVNWGVYIRSDGVLTVEQANDILDRYKLTPLVPPPPPPPPPPPSQPDTRMDDVEGENGRD